MVKMLELVAGRLGVGDQAKRGGVCRKVEWQSHSFPVGEKKNPDADNIVLILALLVARWRNG